MAAIAHRVIRDMIMTTTVATTPTAGAVVIAGAVVTVVTVRAAMVGAAGMVAIAATAGPTADIGLRDPAPAGRRWLTG